MNRLKHIISTVCTIIISFIRESSNIIYNFTNSPQFSWSIVKNKYITHSNHIDVSLRFNHFSQCKITIIGKQNQLIIENGCSIKGAKLHLNNGFIHIKQSTINASWERRVRIAATDGCFVKIGTGCLLSDNIQIHTTDYHPIFDSNNERCNKPENITIGEHVWLCRDVTILKGSIIPDGCVIGTRSIPKKEYDCKNSIIAGVPGKVIRENINWSER